MRSILSGRSANEHPRFHGVRGPSPSQTGPAFSTPPPCGANRGRWERATPAADGRRTDKAGGRRRTVMRVLVVGASGVIGTRLVPQLRRCGHEVIGSCHSPGKAGQVRALGAEPITLDALDATAGREAGAAPPPDAIISHATPPAGPGFSRNLDRSFSQTNRLRTEGTDILLAAAREEGVRRFVAQSFASCRYAREGGWVKTEGDPLDPAPPASARETNAAMTHLDRAVTDAGGIALRYGGCCMCPAHRPIR